MKTPHSSTASGSVLIVVMVVCIGLAGLALLFGNAMLMAYRGEDNNQAGLQAEQAIEGAARYAEYLLTQTTRPGALPDPTTFQSEAPVGDATFWLIGTPSASDSIDKPAFGLVDEASKLNLNTATEAMLLGLPGMTPELADAIVSWRKAASTTGSASGATLVSSTPIKGAPFESELELLLLTGGTGAELLYGADPDLNHATDPDEAKSGGSTFSSGNTNSRIDSGLLEYVTVFSREPNTIAGGTSARLNVTQPVSAALSTLLTNTFGASRGREIEQKIRNAGRVNSVLEFYIRSGMTEAEFEKIAPRLTSRGGAYVAGLINVNTASQTVLACVPGIGAEKAAQLVAARTLQAQPPPATPAWVVPILGEPNAILAGPLLTARSYQFSVDAAAVGRHGHGYRRTRFVIDNSTGTPRIIYRRNLTPLGWALGGDTRQALAAKKESK